MSPPRQSPPFASADPGDSEACGDCRRCGVVTLEAFRIGLGEMHDTQGAEVGVEEDEDLMTDSDEDSVDGGSSADGSGSFVHGVLARISRAV